MPLNFKWSFPILMVLLLVSGVFAAASTPSSADSLDRPSASEVGTDGPDRLDNVIKINDLVFVEIKRLADQTNVDALASFGCDGGSTVISNELQASYAIIMDAAFPGSTMDIQNALSDELGVVFRNLKTTHTLVGAEDFVTSFSNQKTFKRIVADIKTTQSNVQIGAYEPGVIGKITAFLPISDLVLVDADACPQPIEIPPSRDFISPSYLVNIVAPVPSNDSSISSSIVENPQEPPELVSPVSIQPDGGSATPASSSSAIPPRSESGKSASTSTTSQASSSGNNVSNPTNASNSASNIAAGISNASSESSASSAGAINAAMPVNAVVSVEWNAIELEKRLPALMNQAFENSSVRGTLKTFLNDRMELHVLNDNGEKIGLMYAAFENGKWLGVSATPFSEGSQAVLKVSESKLNEILASDHPDVDLVQALKSNEISIEGKGLFNSIKYGLAKFFLNFFSI